MTATHGTHTKACFHIGVSFATVSTDDDLCCCRPVQGPAPRPGFQSLLSQDEVWIDRAGITHRLQEMDPGHCASVIAYLERRAAPMLRRRLVSYLSGPQPTGEMAGDAFDREIEEMDRLILDGRATDWLWGYPLLPALARRTVPV